MKELIEGKNKLTPSRAAPKPPPNSIQAGAHFLISVQDKKFGKVG
jgi:hypothetical protein